MRNLNTHGVTDYASAMRYLSSRGPRTHRAVPLCYATTLRAEGHPSGVDVVVVYHHNEAIIRYWSDGSIEIRNAGYLSSTTTDRLHQMTPREVIVSGARGGSVDSPCYSGDQPYEWQTVVGAALQMVEA